MPNHCSCAIKVTGDKDDMRKFLEVIEDKEDTGEYALENGYPLPKELRGTVKGSEEGRESSGGKTIPFNPGEKQELIKRFGASNWYDWCIENWGTKWGTYRRETGEASEGEFFQNFDTAWSPPSELVAALSDMHPGLRFLLAFSEGGGGFAGTQTFVAGDVVRETSIAAFSVPTGGQDEWGDEECEPCKEWQEHMNKYKLHTGG